MKIQVSGTVETMIEFLEGCLKIYGQPTWESYANDYYTKRCVQKLLADGVIEVNDFCQMKLKNKN